MGYYCFLLIMWRLLNLIFCALSVYISIILYAVVILTYNIGTNITLNFTIYSITSSRTC